MRFGCKKKERLGAKNRKGGALRPRLPVRCRASRPFGTISRRSPRPFGLLITRSAPMVSHESGGVIRPRSLFNVALLRRGSCPGRTRTQPAGEFVAQSTLSTPPHGIAAKPPDRGTSRLRIPSAFSRPWQWATLGLPCPVSFPTVSRRRRISPPAPSTTGHLTTEAYMSKRRVHPPREGLSPLSTGRGADEPHRGKRQSLGPVAAACSIPCFSKHSRRRRRASLAGQDG